MMPCFIINLVYKYGMIFFFIYISRDIIFYTTFAVLRFCQFYQQYMTKMRALIEIYYAPNVDKYV